VSPATAKKFEALFEGSGVTFLERNDNELDVLRLVLDIVSNNKNAPEVKCRVHFVHEVQRCRFEYVKAEDECQRLRAFSPPKRFEMFFQLFFFITKKMVPSENRLYCRRVRAPRFRPM